MPVVGRQNVGTLTQYQFRAYPIVRVGDLYKFIGGETRRVKGFCKNSQYHICVLTEDVETGDVFVDTMMEFFAGFRSWQARFEKVD